MIKLSPAALALAALAATAAHAQDLSHRKSDLQVQVQSLSGVPLEGATVEIEMLNHAFRFGTAVTIGRLEPANGQYNPKVAEEITKYFNSITFENAMKWGPYSRSTPERIVDLANLALSQKAFNGPDNFRLRGHVTLWSQQMPDGNSSLSGEELNQRALDHVVDFHTTLKDVGIDSFDFYNEHMRAPDGLINKIVPSEDLQEQAEVVASWFKKAKEVDPNAHLIFNDYNILNYWGDDDRFVVEYKEFIDAVRDAGGPVDGIGLQAHMDRFTSRERIDRRLDLLSAPMAPTENHPNGLPGLPIEITELDINTQQWTNATDEQQAQVTQNVLEGAFEHPAVTGVTIWVMNDSQHWRGNAILFDDSDPNNWVVKQSGQVWIDKVLGEWWQDHAGASSANGDYTANTFKGTHRVAVTYNGETQERIVSLADDDTATFAFATSAAEAATFDAWAGFIAWDVADPARDADPDGDDRSNFDEFVAGTDPLVRDHTSSPVLLDAASGAAKLRYAHRAADQALLVTVERSSDLSANSWQAVALPEILPQKTVQDGIATYTVSLPIPFQTGFYRIRITEASQP